jgi:iron(III) transport system substrate-binding protein
MSRCKTALLAAACACAALLLGACGGSSGANTLTIYSGQHEQTTGLLVSRFERETGIKVSVRSGDEQALGNQVLQEGGSSPADVFYSENSPVLESLREHGLLAPVEPATLAAVPSRYSAADGRWVGVSARLSALVYNPAQLGGMAPPSSILELAAPAWKGKVAFAPTETDFQPLVSAIAKLEGMAAAEHWLLGMQANGRTYPDNETVITQVNSGQSAIAPVNHYYWFRLRDELGAGGMHSALHYLAPGDPGAVLDVSGAAVLASSSHQAAAQRFLAFLVSPAGQQTIARSHSYEYPLRPGVAAAPGLRPLSQITPAPVTPAALGDGSATLALEQKLGLL